VKALIKRFLLRRAPLPYIWAKDVAGRLYEPDMRSLLLARYSRTVASGPFEGMRYIDRSTCGALVPKLVGTYEQELHAVVEQIKRTPYTRVVVIGSAEGYYAVGLARAMPLVQVHAYDIDERARQNTLETAAINGTASRTIIAGECTHEELERFRSETVLVVCDIEGAELGLLDPDKAPSLRSYDMIVELHDAVGATRVRDALKQRFGSSHEIQFVQYTGRTRSNSSVLPWWLSRRARFLALDEWRLPEQPMPTGAYGMEWGVFRARRGEPAGVSSR
jgi:hypothetical protein